MRIIRVAYDEICVGVNKISEKCGSIKLINRYNGLLHEESAEHSRAPEIVNTSPIYDVGQSTKAILKSITGG